MADVLDNGDWEERRTSISQIISRLQDRNRYAQNVRLSDQELANRATSELEIYLSEATGYIPVDNDLTTRAMRDLRNSYQADLSEDVRLVDAEMKRISEDRSQLDAKKKEVPSIEELEKGVDSAVDKRLRELKSGARYKILNEEFQNEDQLYDLRLKEALGEQPRNYPWWPLWIILLGLGTLEFLINQPAFLDWLRSPVFAFGATIAVLLAVAWNSEIIGKTAKQKSHLKLRRNWDKWALRVSTLLFITAMVTVFWARFSYYWGLSGGGRRTLDGSVDWDAVVTVLERAGPTLLFNIIIWGFGAGVAWYWYEKVPGLRESYRKRNRIQNRMIKEEEKASKNVRNQAERESYQAKAEGDTKERQIERRLQEISAAENDIETARANLTRFAQEELNILMARYRRVIANTKVEGFAADLIGFKSPDGRTHTLGQFASQDDSHTLIFKGDE